MKVVVNIISLYYQTSFNIDGLDINKIYEFFQIFNLDIRNKNIYNDNYEIIEMNEYVINMTKNFIDKNMKNKNANMLINKLKNINIKDFFCLYFRVFNNPNNDIVNHNDIEKKSYIMLMQHYRLPIEQFEKDTNFINENYLIRTSICFEDRGIYTYEKNNEGKKCKYCGKENFKSYSHIIPENLGGYLIDAEECDDCNKLFNETREQEFSQYIELFRTIFGISGKKHVPTTKGNNSVTVKFKRAKNNTELNKIITFIQSDDDINSTLKNIPIEKNINFHKLYKCLSKIALGLIPYRDIDKFSETIKWIKDETMFKEVPKLIEIDCLEKINIFKKPSITILLRKNIDDYSIPYMFANLNCRFKSFFYIVPFTEYDKNNFTNKIDFDNFLKSVKLLPNRINLVDCNINEKTKFTYNIHLADNVIAQDVESLEDLKNSEEEEIIEELNKFIESNKQKNIFDN